MRLRERLFLLVLVSILPLVGLSVVQEYREYVEARAAAYDRLLSLSRGLTISIERDQQMRSAALLALAVAPSLRNGDMEAFRPVAETFLLHQPTGSHIGVVNERGELLMAVGNISRQPGTTLPVSEMDTVGTVFGTGEPAVSNVYRPDGDGHDSSGQLGFRVDVPVTANDRVVYDLFIGVPSWSLTRLLSQQHLPDDAVAAILDSNGVILGRVPSAERYVGSSAVPEVVARLRNGTEGVLEVPTLEGTPSIAAISFTARSRWGVVVGLPRQDLIDRLRSDVITSLSISAAVLLSALVLAALAARRITGPIIALRRMALTPPGGPISTGLPEADEVAGALLSVEDTRRESAAALLESEQRFRALFDHAPSGTILVNPRTLQIVDCNDAAANIVGRTCEDLKRIRIVDMWSRNDLHKARAALQRLRHGDTHRFETSVVGTNGRRDLIAAVAMVRVGGRVRLLVSQIDITDLRRAENEARRNEEHLRLATEAADLGIWWRDLTTDEVVSSPRFRSLMGLPAAGALDFEGTLAVVHPDDRLAVRSATAAGGTSQAEYTLEFRVVWPDQSLHWIRSRGRVRRDPDNGRIIGIQGITQGIDEEREAALRLAESEHRLELARDGANLGIWDWNVAGRVLTWDRRQWCLHGLPPREEGPSYEMWRGLLHPDDREHVRSVGIAALNDPANRFEIEYRIMLPDGSVRWLLGRAKVERGPDGKPLRIVGINIDITPRKEAEQTLRDTAGLLRLTHQIAETGSFEWEVGAEERTISEQYAAICGLPKGTTREPWRHAKARVHPEDRPAVADLINRTLAGEIPGYTSTFRIVRTDDRVVRYVTSRVEPITHKGRMRLIGILRDVTEDRAAQQELQRLNRNLEARVEAEVTAREAAQRRAAQAERMQALGQIAGGIAHDFNNVLQAVSGGAALIERQADNPEGVRRHVRMIADASRRGAAITSRLLAFARRGDLRAERIDAALLLTDLSEVLGHTLGRLVTTRSIVADGLPPLFADRGQLETVLVNLATNARDAMPGGGTLTMSARLEVVAHGTSHSANLSAGTYVTMSIADTGEGMSPAVLARATDPFFTTKEPGKGTGLGLPMAKGFAEQSGGGIGIESEIGKGTTVTLWLPVAAESPLSKRPAEKSRSAQRTRARVLLVDDDPIVLEVMTAALEDMGYAVVQVNCGQAAINVLSGGEPLDILVTDLTMPGMDGLSVIRAAQKLYPSLPAILVTGYAGDGAALAVGGSIRGSFSLVRKPVSGTQLADRIAALLEAHVEPDV